MSASHPAAVGRPESGGSAPLTTTIRIRLRTPARLRNLELLLIIAALAVAASALALVDLGALGDVEAVDHRDAEARERRRDRHDERVALGRDEALCDVQHEHEARGERREGEHLRVDLAHRAEVDEREGRRGDAERDDDEQQLEVAQARRCAHPDADGRGEGTGRGRRGAHVSPPPPQRAGRRSRARRAGCRR